MPNFIENCWYGDFRINEYHVKQGIKKYKSGVNRRKMWENWVFKNLKRSASGKSRRALAAIIAYTGDYTSK
jgi:hypothetical protein